MSPVFDESGIELHLADCMDLMAQYPDGHFDLAIVDPPYGIGISNNPVRQAHIRKAWDSKPPPADYFLELRRVSLHQVIWGGNYFTLPPSQGFVIWDKQQPHDFSLATCEYAWSSIQSPAKMFRRSVLAENGKIHPTQKPVALYLWLLTNYAKPGQRILDTHLGSGSIAIACHRYGCPLVASEIDADYMAGAVGRIRRELSQGQLFPPAAPVHEQAALI